MTPGKQAWPYDWRKGSPYEKRNFIENSRNGYIQSISKLEHAYNGQPRLYKKASMKLRFVKSDKVMKY